MGQAADHFECVLKAFDGMSTPKQDAGLLDDVIQEPGAWKGLRWCVFFDPSVFAIGFAKQHSRRRIMVILAGQEILAKLSPGTSVQELTGQ
jgi:hypothetical protein